MATAATKFRIDVSIHNLLQDSNRQKPVQLSPRVDWDDTLILIFNFCR